MTDRVVWKLVFFVALVAGSAPFFVWAANDVSFSESYSVEMIATDTSAPVILTAAGGVVSELTAGGATFDMTFDAGSSAVLSVPPGFYFNVSKLAGTDSYAVSPSCVTNSLTFAATGNATLRITVDTSAPSCASGGGGGGGGGTAISQQSVAPEPVAVLSAPVSTAPVAKPDANSDNKVNLIDFSIFLFWWGTADLKGFAAADFNDDQKVNLVDFSIMLSRWTG